MSDRSNLGFASAVGSGQFAGTHGYVASGIRTKQHDQRLQRTCGWMNHFSLITSLRVLATVATCFFLVAIPQKAFPQG